MYFSCRVCIVNQIMFMLLILSTGNKEVPRVSRGEMFFANSFVIQLAQSCNFKRSGNFSGIKCSEARKELNRAIAIYQKKFPGRPLVSGGKAHFTLSGCNHVLNPLSSPASIVYSCLHCLIMFLVMTLGFIV